MLFLGCAKQAAPMADESIPLQLIDYYSHLQYSIQGYCRCPKAQEVTGDTLIDRNATSAGPSALSASGQLYRQALCRLLGES